MKINYGKLLFINFIFILFIELLFKFFVMKTFDIGILYISIFSLFVSIIITFVSSIFKKNKINKMIYIILLILIDFILIAETVYFSFYKTICGFGALAYGGQVMDFASTITSHIIENIIVILLMIIPCISLIVLTIKNKILNDRFYKYETLLLLIGSFMVINTSLVLFKDDTSSSYNLLYKTNDLLESTNRFGVLSSVTADAYKVITKFEESVSVVSTRTFTKNEKKEYNMIDIDFKESSDDTINNMNEYFKNETPTEKNKYTGIYAGKNIVFIVAEGFYPIAVNEKYTPTLYKMVNNGFVFDNYYQPIYNCSTSDGEFINNLSLLPGVSTCSMNSTVNTYLPYSLGNIMDNYGYSTYAFHGWTYSYYNRDKTHPNLGYIYYGYDRYKRGYKYALKGIEDSWPTSDIDVVNSSYDIYKNDSQFVAYYMSISGHLQYSFSGNDISRKNKELVDGLDASASIKAYIASQIEFDKSLELLMNKLKEDNKLDDTVFIISADHYPYGLKDKEIMEYDENVKDKNFDLYKNNLIIYNTTTKTEHIEKYTSSLDVLPTVLNLFGVSYDSRLLMGKDIFSNAEGLVIFNNKSWITDKGRYNYLTKKFESFTDEEITDDYIKEINSIVDMKFKMSKLIISKDYYRKVLGD